ncbi:DNA repair protein RecN [Ramlibacter sp. PS4R-6]|uniref:DNA repair protein RecN n=1 Tax=Ramlibacter sp. PS4R-6 TaxID=3133438 RepID=UPI0030979BD5
MALRRIALRDFVIVRELELELDGGFSVLTGETGAGKSILVDALQLALGSRAEAAVVREGAVRAEITAEFDMPAALAPWLEEAGFDKEDALLVRRSIDNQGKSRAWINGSPATATQLRELADSLVDIHGQHAWQSLTRADAVRQLLDGYAALDTQLLRDAWHKWRTAGKTLADARAAQETLTRERERLAWQIGEVDKLAPGADEWDALNTSHTRLANAQSLLEAAQGAIDALEGDEGGATRSLAHAQSLLGAQEHVEPQFREIGEVLASSLAQLEDAAHSLHAYLRKTELDPQRLAELDERMSLWLSLARRFRRTPAELPAQLASWKEELARLDAAADLAGLEATEKKAHEAYVNEARAVSKARAKAAPQLAKAVTAAMQGLGMQGGRFEVQLQALAEPQQSGMEEVAFLVAGHAGSTPRPVGKVASGGELSRIALAIAVTTSRLGTAQTLIFDEVDAGVGGAVAETVGRLMKQLGRDRQVLAVTHLPQVASCADHHLVVAKQSDAKGPSSSVAPVNGEHRVAEIARMLGGERLSGTTLAHAKEMLSGAKS